MKYLIGFATAAIWPLIAADVSVPPRQVLDKSLRGSSFFDNPGTTPRIVGGDRVSTDKYPWYSALFNTYDFFYCGGQLISPNYVLTGA